MKSLIKIAQIAGPIILFVGFFGILFPYLPIGDSALLNEVAHMVGNEEGTENLVINKSNRLTIPLIGVDMQLIAGNSASALAKGGWIFPGTSEPEKEGNTVIFGHRFKYLPPKSNTFYSLDKVRKGDRFKIIWNESEYDYTVVDTKIIQPDDFSILEQERGDIVTLVTCSPLFSVKERLVVVGELNAEEQENAP